METKQYVEDLDFDRTAKCDWCGKRRKVSTCKYGTTHYVRLICKECANKINDFEKSCFGGIYFNPEKITKSRKLV